MADKDDSKNSKSNSSKELPSKNKKLKGEKSSKRSSEKQKSLTPISEKETALKLFKGNKSEAKEKDLGLDKADLSFLGSNTGLRGHTKKPQINEEQEAIKRNIILAAQNLLKIAGTSVEDLNNGGKEVKKAGFGNTNSIRSKLLNAGGKEYMESDLSLITHGDVEQFEATKLKNDDSEAKKSPFAAKNKKKEDLDDPFEGSALNPKPQEANETEITASNSKAQHNTAIKGFYHYFGITALVLMVIGSIVYGIFSLTRLLTADDDPELYVETEGSQPKESLDLLEQKVLATDVLNDSPVLDEAKSVLENFLSADSKRFAYTFIIQEKGISKIFNKYWEKSDAFNPELLQYEHGYILPGQLTWLSFIYGEGTDLKRLVLIKSEDKPFRIDWQTYSEIEQVPLSDVVSAIKTEPYFIRAWITPKHNYSAQYSDAHWQNYVAYDLKGNTINCYVPLSTLSAQSIYQSVINKPLRYPAADPELSGSYVKLMVRKPQIGADYLEIMEVLDTTWFPEVKDL